MIPGALGLRVFALEHATPGERTQQTGAYLGLYFGQRFGAEGAGFVKVRAACGIGLENPVDNNAVKTKR